MKNKLALLIPSLLLYATSLGATVTTGLTSFKMTPLHLDGGITNMEATVKASSTSVLSLSIYIINDLYPDGYQIITSSFKTNVTRKFTYSNEYTRSSNQIKLVWTQSKKTLNATYNVDVVSGTVNRINASTYSYSSKGKYCSYTPSGGWTKTIEKLTFTNFQDTYMPNFYHKIDLSDFKIKPTNAFSTTLTCTSAKLYISNQNHYFDSFTQNGGRAEIPLKLVKSSSTYYLAFDQDVFVNPTTLRMYSTKVGNAVSTKHFYFPVNEKRNEEQYSCDVRINGLGIDGSSFLTSFRYKSVLNILGDCRNSEYCIAYR